MWRSKRYYRRQLNRNRPHLGQEKHRKPASFPLPPYKDDIVLIQQFHIPKHKQRLQEIQDTLRKNLDNPHISKIYLLNERLYTAQGLGFTDGTVPSKIQQIVITQRLSYYTAFHFAKTCIHHAWVILSNNDIWYDTSIANLFRTMKRSNKYQKPKCICLTRIELDPVPEKYNTSACQDSWIFYSEECPPPHHTTKFLLGVPGCDNRIAFLLQQTHQLHNCPSIIRSFHNHRSQIRYYDTKTDRIPGPYHFITPT